MNALFSITSSSKCSSILDAKKILLNKAMVHAIPKQVTTNPLISAGHWLHRWQAALCTARWECVCNPVVPQDCQTHCTLQFDWLHKVFYSLKIFALSPCAWTVCCSLRIASGEHLQKWLNFYRGKGSCTTAPLFQQDVEWLTWKDMQ